MLGLCVMCVLCTAAATLRLVWNPSASTNVVDYKVYRGPASNTYDWMQSAGNSTQFSLSGLPEGKFTFTVTAVNDWGLESEPAIPIWYTNNRPAAPNLKQPVF